MSKTGSFILHSIKDYEPDADDDIKPQVVHDEQRATGAVRDGEETQDKVAEAANAGCKRVSVIALWDYTEVYQV